MNIFIFLLFLIIIGCIIYFILLDLDIKNNIKFIIMMVFFSLAIVTILVDYYFNKREKIIIITDLELCVTQDNKTGLKEIEQCNNYKDVYYLGNNIMLKNVK